MTYLERAIQDGHAIFIGEGKQQKIKYIAANHTEKYIDPEEQVRAEFWAELIYRYEYEPNRIGIEVTIPDRTPRDRADLIVFHDDERKKPYAVIECKQEYVTDVEFNQAVEQVVGNASWQKMRADYVMVVAGITRRAFDFSGDIPIGERNRNIIADLPIAYGKPLEFKYRKGIENSDIEEVTQEELSSAIKKSHQTLWGAGKFSPPQAFSELCKIIFIKMSDEKIPRDIGEPYQFQIKTYETNQQLASRIHALYN
ncbi:MAG: type I restriction enzyme HsdR N-terminal domain-containing protein, partial [Phototrophicales bacterium]|nr:type I restriction enzyme HsdR N-terminal domain-containing protein [Phototrophicales bacterium]